MDSENSGSRFYELTEGNIGQSLIRAFGKTWFASSFIGRVMPQDVGKRVFLRGGVLQVENNEQRAARLQRQP